MRAAVRTGVHLMLALYCVSNTGRGITVRWLNENGKKGLDCSTQLWIRHTLSIVLRPRSTLSLVLDNISFFNYSFFTLIILINA